jgi:antirestriction protein ArdC
LLRDIDWYVILTYLRFCQLGKTQTAKEINQMARNLYQDVAQRILNEMQNGATPWIKPWSATPGRNIPHNAATGRPYSGANVILLWMNNAAFATPRYLTFKQAKDLGGNVRKGEHGFKVYFVKQLEFKKDDASDETRRAMMLREYTVFNVAQCENLPEKITAPVTVKPRNQDERDASIDEFLNATGADIREGYGEAYFAPGQDFISMPAFAAFRSAAHFYNVNFHELAHWTGAKRRLDRDFSGRFGTRAYAAEELVAELSAAFLCAEFNVDGELRHAGYLSHWIELLKDDPRAFFTAASKAQAAANYLRDMMLAHDIPLAA